MAVVAESGADALTMGSLADRAGISKPVVYEHFRRRSGLLIAQYPAYLRSAGQGIRSKPCRAHAGG